MISAIAIVGEVFGRCVEKIDVSVGARTRKLIMLQEQVPEDSLLDKAAQDWYWRWVMVPGIGCRFGLLEGDSRNKKPLWKQGLWVVCSLHLDAEISFRTCQLRSFPLHLHHPERPTYFRVQDR